MAQYLNAALRVGLSAREALLLEIATVLDIHELRNKRGQEE